MSGDRRLKTALELFHGGRFADSQVLCDQLAADGVDAPPFLVLAGELALLRNRPESALPLLAAAVAADADAPRPRALLAETYRRAGQLQPAAALFHGLGRPALAAKLAAAGDGWYRRSGAAETTLDWLAGSGVAAVEAEVGGCTGRFVIDTGVGETLLDPALADAAGVVRFGAEPIQFPAGPAGTVEHGLLGRLGLGQLAFETVPVQVYPTRLSMAALLPFPVDGVIGTGVLSRLPVVLDYGRRRLLLGGDGIGSGGSPLYWAGDQYPLLPARLNDQLDTLLFLDTGMSGTALALPPSTAVAAGIEVAAAAEGVGFGVEHYLSARRLHCARLLAGGVERHDVPGMLLERFRLERQLGFRIGGLLGDGFIGAGRLRLDFRAMRVALEDA